MTNLNDCFYRLHVGMQAWECLKRVRGRAELILDTTYCSPQYTFPPQDDVRLLLPYGTARIPNTLQAIHINV